MSSNAQPHDHLLSTDRERWFRLEYARLCLNHDPKMREQHEQEDDRQDHRDDLLCGRRERKHPENEKHDVNDQRENEQPDKEGNQSPAGEETGGEKESVHTA